MEREQAGRRIIGRGFEAANWVLIGGIGAKGLLGRVSVGEGVTYSAITTPRGLAVQELSLDALLARERVINGATLFRAGTFGRQATSAGQFWALENPMGFTPEQYIARYGIPTGPVTDWVIGGRLQPGMPFITRTAQKGTGIEAVVAPSGVKLEWFVMP